MEIVGLDELESGTFGDLAIWRLGDFEISGLGVLEIGIFHIVRYGDCKIWRLGHWTIGRCGDL